jgi:hypothetical protein
MSFWTSGSSVVLSWIKNTDPQVDFEPASNGWIANSKEEEWMLRLAQSK